MIFTPLPLSQTVTLSQTPSPSPLEHDILYGRPHMASDSMIFTYLFIWLSLILCVPKYMLLLLSLLLLLLVNIKNQ